MRKHSVTMPLLVYRLLTWLLAPLIALWLRRRVSIGKEDGARLRERFGHASLARPAGTLLWIHAASVGESLSVLPLIEKLLASHGALHILVTTGTVTSARLLKDRLPPRGFHQFVPVDTPGAVRRFIGHWKPEIACWVESELWPNLLLTTHAAGCRMALLNARLSASSYRSWRRFPRSARALLGCFETVFAQSAEDAQRLTELGAANVHASGNLKFDAPSLPDFSERHASLGHAIGSRPVWLAASTHPGEEALVAQAHHLLRKNYPNLLTVLAPRHPERGDVIVHELRSLAIARRSQEEPVAATTDIYLADTMGELGIFYRLCPIAFIGGSLVPHGGQNPLEAARLGCAIITGPHTHNFADIARLLKDRHALLRVTDAGQLAATVGEILRDTARQKQLADNARRVVAEQQGATDAIARELSQWINTPSLSLDAFMPDAAS